MSSTYEARLQSILKSHLTPLLKGKGFTKRSNTYYLELNELTWLIEIERSGFNDATQVSFTVVCGVYIPGVMSRFIIADRAELKNPKYSDCTVFARLGWLAPMHMDTWWTLSLIDNSGTDDAIGEDIVQRIENDALPFLGRFPDSRSVIAFLQEPRKECESSIEPSEVVKIQIFAAIIALLLGDREQGEAAIALAEGLAAKNPLWSDFADVKEKVLATQP